MGYGIRITNPSSELVISSGAFGLYCIGKAVLQGSVGQESGNPTDPDPGGIWGTSIYRISHAGPIICAIDLPLDKRVGVVGINQPSAGVWDIEVYCGDTPDSYGIDTAHYAIDVWAYGLPQSAPAGWGAAIYDASHNCAYDLTQLLLFPRAYVTGAAPATGFTTGAAATIPSLTRPVVIGHPVSMDVAEQLLGANHRAVYRRRGLWRRTSSTSLETQMVVQQRFEYFGPDSLFDSFEDRFDTPAFIIEGSGLP